MEDTGGLQGGDVQGYLPEWMANFVTNLGLYFVLFGFGYLFVRHYRSQPEPNPADRSFQARFIRWIVFGPPELVPDVERDAKREKDKVEYSFGMKALLLFGCTAGLLGSYLSWGVLQERIITTDYATGKFQSSNFLVFCNRILALSVALIVTRFVEQPPMRAPFYKFSFTSLSNVLSSFCQLEALKYVSFPTQVLAKSSKLIPVMIMGKLISKKKYPIYEYVIAVTIGFGVALFMMSQKASEKEEKSTTFAGVFLLSGYLVFDSFTSQWQGHLFTEYKMTSYQMMIGVNVFSASLTFISLLQTGELFSSLSFVMQNVDCFVHIFMFSTAGAIGQLFIFFTIKTFGPLVFTMIMTTRQLIAIILSCLLYGHVIYPGGVLGAVIVFGAIGYRIHRQSLEKKAKDKAAELARFEKSSTKGDNDQDTIVLDPSDNDEENVSSSNRNVPDFGKKVTKT